MGSIIKKLLLILLCVPLMFSCGGDTDIGRYQLLEERTEYDDCKRKRVVRDKFDTKTGESDLIIISEDDEYGVPCSPFHRNFHVK